MGLLDKLKDTVSAVAEKAKETVDTAKAAYEQKKAEEAQHKAEMEALAAGKANEIVSSIKAYENDGSFVKDIHMRFDLKDAGYASPPPQLT